MTTLTLKPRFLAPAGWQTQNFINPQTGHKIRFGCVYPEDHLPLRGVIVLLQGLSEFSEKYFETMHDLLERGYAVWIMDWQYQGRSGRLADFSHRRHSDGFAADVSDLHYFIHEHVKQSHSSDTPLYFLGHSMGGHIGLRYLVEYAGDVTAAGFSAPFLGIYRISMAERALITFIRPFLDKIGTAYIPGGKDWREEARKGDGSDIFSSDPERDSLHQAWMAADPALQVGQITYRWVIEALDSCAFLMSAGTLERIKIPVLFGIAGQEKIVNNAAIHQALSRLPRGIGIELNGAHHEIFMERDEWRTPFLQRFYKLVESGHNPS